MSVCRWHHLHKWLKKWALELGGEHILFTKNLTRELALFIEEQDMASEEPDALGFSIWQLMAQNSSYKKLENSMYLVRDGLEDIWPSGHKLHGDGPYWDNNYTLFWDWCYPFANHESWYVAWGIWFPEHSSCWKELNPPPMSQSVFVEVATEKNNKAPIPFQKLALGGSMKASQEWLWPKHLKPSEQENCLKVHSLADLYSSEKGSTQAFLDWLRPSAKEALAIPSGS